MKRRESVEVLTAARARGNIGRAGLGVAEDIRKALRQRPCGFDELVGRLSGKFGYRYSRKQVRVALSHMVGISGGVQSDGKRPATYSVVAPSVEVTVLAPMIPLRRDPFAAWRLCDRDPFETSKSATLSVIR